MCDGATAERLRRNGGAVGRHLEVLDREAVGDGAPAPKTHPVTFACAPTRAPGPMIDARTTAPAPTAGPCVDDAVLDDGAVGDPRFGADGAPRAEGRAKLDVGGRRDPRRLVGLAGDARRRGGRSAPAGTSLACRGPSSTRPRRNRTPDGRRRSPWGRSRARSRSRDRGSTARAPPGRSGTCPRSRRRGSGPRASHGRPAPARPRRSRRGRTRGRRRRGAGRS